MLQILQFTRAHISLTLSLDLRVGIKLISARGFNEPHRR